MSPQKKHTASGVITFHSPFPVRWLKSEECIADMEESTGSRRSPSQPSGRTRSIFRFVRAGTRDEASPCGPQPSTKRDWLSHPSLRQLQARLEAENQEAKEVIQPLLDRENGFVKGLERFLSQREVAELRRRELQHKRWTECVWFPLQRKVEEHVSRCGPVEAKRRQSLYNHYLHHCNSKGFVFLETYDLREYNPFLLSIKKPHFKLSAADFKDKLYLQLQEKRGARSYEAGFKYKLPQSNDPLTESVASQAGTLRQDSSLYAASASPVRDESGGRKSSRLDTIPYHISATAAPDGRCHRTSCCFSRCGCLQQPASLHQSLPISK